MTGHSAQPMSVRASVELWRIQRRDLKAEAKSFPYPKNAWNIENGELYAVSPFRLFGIGKPDLETGLNTYRRRLFLDVAGWTYDGQCAWNVRIRIRGALRRNRRSWRETSRA